MRRIRLALAVVIGVSVTGLAAPPKPAAAQGCGEMLMPVVQLKTVGRGVSRHHAGIDLMAPYGSPVRAAAAGIVAYVGRYYAYGNIIDIAHPDGSLTRYAHLSRYVPGLKPGSQVELGQTIAAVGTTGNAHGAHLHFEVRRNGHAIDPKPFIQLANCMRPAPAERLEVARAAAPNAERFIDARPGGLFQ
jgi:hypothetical protein